MGKAVLVLPRMFGKLLSVLARNYCMFSVSNDASVAIPVCVKPMECSEYSEPIQDAAFEVSFQAPSSVTGYLLVDVFLRVSQSSWKVEKALLVYSHTAFRALQFAQGGPLSSHVIRRCFHRLQPSRDFV